MHIIFFCSDVKRVMVSNDMLAERLRNLIACLNEKRDPDAGSVAGSVVMAAAAEEKFVYSAEESSSESAEEEPAPVIDQTGVLHDGAHNIVRTGWNGERVKNVVAQVDNYTIDETVLGFADKMDEEHIGLQWGDQLRNIFKKCPGCGKPNAVSMKQCNACPASLPEETSIGPNPFIGFMYGVRYIKEEDECRMSVRSRTPDVLVCDDPLSLSPCHMLALPMSRYIPDWRFLLRCPRLGLRILEELENEAWTCAQKCLDGDLKEIFGSYDLNAEKADLLMGLNYPPSMSQLHVQCILAPMLPHEYNKFINGGHFTVDRFFPLEYVKKVLELGECMDVTINTPIQDIINKFNGDVNYKMIHESFLENVHYRQELRGVWTADKFQGNIRIESTKVSDDPRIKEDKMKLRNYDLGGLSYYEYPKNCVVPSWVDNSGIKFEAMLHMVHPKFNEPAESSVNKWACSRLIALGATTSPAAAKASAILLNLVFKPDDDKKSAAVEDVKGLFTNFLGVFGPE